MRDKETLSVLCNYCESTFKINFETELGQPKYCPFCGESLPEEDEEEEDFESVYDDEEDFE